MRLCPQCGKHVSQLNCGDCNVPTMPLKDDHDTQESVVLGAVFAEKYRIEALVGEGGMGSVYRAQQLNINRPVAIKTLHGSLLGQEAFLRRFRREARAASRLSSPHVVRVFDFGLDEARGIPFIVMELLEGDNLFDVLDNEGVFSLSRAVEVCLQVSRALVDAEEAGIVHRDLKPENVFLGKTPDGGDFAKVMDFGVARLSPKAGDTEVAHNTSSVIVGTPKYMAPEQVRGEEVGPKADLYALGCLLHYMVTGRAPYERDDNFAIMEAHLKSPIPALPAQGQTGQVVPTSMVELYCELMAKTPRARPSGARDTLRKLSRVRDDIRAGKGGISPRPSAGNKTQVYGSPYMKPEASHTPSHDLSGGLAATDAGPSLVIGDSPVVGERSGDASAAFATTAAGPSLVGIEGAAAAGSEEVSDLKTVATPSLVISQGNQGASAPAGISEASPPVSAAKLDERPKEDPAKPARVKSQTIVDFGEAFPNKNKQLVGIALGIVAIFVVGFAFVFSPSANDAAQVEAEKGELVEENVEKNKVSGQGDEKSAPAVAPEEEPKPTVPAEPAPAPTERAKVLVESEPVGAEVRRNGILLGKTPMELNPERDQASFHLKFELVGYESAEQEVIPGNTETVRALLSPKAAPRPARVRRGPRPAPRSTPPPAPRAPRSGPRNNIDTMLD